MTSQADLKSKILHLLREYERCGVSALARSTITKTLKVSPSVALPALMSLIREGRVEYAKNTHKAAQPQYKLAGGRTK